MTNTKQNKTIDQLIMDAEKARNALIVLHKKNEARKASKKAFDYEKANQEIENQYLMEK